MAGDVKCAPNLAEQFEAGSFRERSQRALTHPVTLAAIALLLLNDWVFKALWQNDWTTGKFSDLAWVVFASPLLAFLLSLVIGRNRTAQRLACIAAYLGLPVLYALFNTFEPVHEIILRVLSLGLGKPAGGLPDPTDSLMIPFGLVIAFWVWRSSGNGFSGAQCQWRFPLTLPALPRVRRERLTFLVAAISIAATLATTSSPPNEGVAMVGVTVEGVLTAWNGQRSGYYRSFSSNDGGLTWSQDVNRDAEPPGEGPVEWGGERVVTPRGTYLIEGTDIVLADGGQRRIAYSAKFLSDSGNENIQKFATSDLAGNYVLSTGPLSVAYDPHSGNVVAAMGIQGVVVGTPDGNWTRVAVGPYEPTDFSLKGRLLALSGELDIQFALLSLGAAFTAIALAVSNRSQPTMRRALLLTALSVIWLIGGFILLFLAYYLFPFPLVPYALSPYLNSFAFSVVLPFLLVFFLLLAAIVLYRREGLSRGAFNDFSVSAATLSVLLATLAVLSADATTPPYSTIGDLILSNVFPVAIAGLAMALIAIALTAPKWRELPVVALVVVGLYLLANLAFLFGIPLNGLGDISIGGLIPASPVAIAGLVMALVAIALTAPKWGELLLIALMVGLYLLANLALFFGIPFVDSLKYLGAAKFLAVTLVSLAALFYAWGLRRSRSSDVS